MGLNAVRNAAKLRKVSGLIGEPCVYAASRYFADQKDLIAFGASGAVWAVNLHKRTAERYEEPGRILTPYRHEGRDGYSGVHSVPAEG